MHVQVVLMHALSRAQIDIFTPGAAQQQVPFADRAAHRTSFQQLSNNMAGDFPPRFHHFLFFLQLVELFVAHHGQRPPSDILS